jgi:hypothetical protein
MSVVKDIAARVALAVPRLRHAAGSFQPVAFVPQFEIHNSTRNSGNDVNREAMTIALIW